MGSSDALETRKLMSRGVVKQVAYNTGVAIRLKFVRNAALSVTSVVVTTATDITVTWSDSSTTVYDFATYATVGALVDKINADGYFEAKALDTLRSYATASQFVEETVSASTIDGVVFYDIKVDSSASFYIAYRLSPNRKMLEGRAVDSLRVHLQEIKYFANVSGATADSVQIWDCNNTDETKLFTATTVDATTTTITFNSGDNKLTALGDKHELVVVVKDAPQWQTQLLLE